MCLFLSVRVCALITYINVCGMCYQGACILFSVGFWFAIPTFGRPPLLTPHAPLPTHRPLSYRNPQAIAHVLSVLTSTGKADKLKGFELVKAVHLDHQ